MSTSTEAKSVDTSKFIGIGQEKSHDDKTHISKMQSLAAEPEINGVAAVTATSSDKLDETLVAQAIQCLDMEKLRNDIPQVRSYQASVPAALDPKTSDALDRLGVVLASTQLRIVGQTCTPKEIHIARLSPNSMQLDISVQDIIKANSRFVVANLGPDAQVGCVWFYGDPPNVFSGQFEKVDPGKFRAVRCTAPSQLSLRVNAAFASPCLDDCEARRRSVANKYTLVMFVFCHDKNPKPTPIVAAAATPTTKRKITSAAVPEEKVKVDAKDTDSNDNDDDDDEGKLNGNVDEEEEAWTSAESVKLAVAKQRDKLRTATGQDLNALKALAVERGKSVEDIITAVSWWVLGRASSLSRSLGSFFLAKPYDWFDVVYARLPLESRRLTPALAATNEAILQPYVFNILTVLLNNVGLVPQWTVHHAKLLEKYRAQLKKFKVLEIMGSEPFIDGLTNECTVFTFQKAFSFLFCLRMLRHVTPDQLLRMSPAGVVDPIKPKLDEYLRCKDGNKQKPADSSTKQVKRKVDETTNDDAKAVTTVDESTKEEKKPKKKPRHKASSVSSSSSEAESSEEEDDKAADQPTKKKKSKTKKNEQENKAVSSEKKKKKTKKNKHQDDKDEEEGEEPKKKKKAKSTGGKDKALLTVSKTASKAPVDTRNDDDDEDGITVSMVMPAGMLQANAKHEEHVQLTKEYTQLMKVTRDLVKSGDEKQIGEYDWIAAADQMQRVRPLFSKLMPAPTNRTATTGIELGSKILKLRPVNLLKTSLLHIVSMNVQSFISKLVNAECEWDVLKVSDNHLPSFEARTSHAYQFARESAPSDVKDQAYVVELQYHPGVRRISSIGVFKEPNITGPKINRLLDSSLFAEIWYIGPLPELERLKFDFGRIADVVSVIE